jgi:chitinase
VRRHLLALGGIVAALALSGAADASWAISGSGNGSSRATSVPTGSVPSHTLPTYPNVALAWSAVTVGGAAASYTVRRYSETGVLEAIGASCSGTVAANACTESSVPVGRWQYTTQATKGSWLGAESTKSTTVEIAAAPTSVTCTNCHTYSGTSYINSSISAAVQLQAVFPSTSLATDTANLSLTDTASHSVSTSKAAPAGAGTLSFSTVTTAGFADGAVTAGSYVTANTSDVSPTRSLALVRDTAAPTASNVAPSNGGTAKKADNGDRINYVFSEPVDPTTVKSGWNGSSATVSAVFTNSASADTVAVTGTNLGTVNTQADYVSAALTCSTSTISMSGAVVTLTLGGCLPATAQRTNVAATAFKWTPSVGVTDLAGNAMSTTLVTGSTAGL